MKKSVVAALSSLLAMNVVCLGMLTFAWFTANQRADNSMGQITAISDDPLDVDFELYEYDEDNRSGRIAVDKEKTGDRFALPQYDTFIKDRNVHNNKILRMEIISKGDTSSDTTFNVDIPSNGDFTDSNDHVCNNMSNIIGFKYFLKHDSIAGALDETSASTIYDSAFDIFDTIDTSFSYVTVSDGVGTKAIDKTIHLRNLDIDETADDKITVLYIEYFYDETLVDYYFDNSDVGQITADNLEGTAISFDCDIVRFEFAGEAN
ncbi:MAG: hypothetical protein MJ238_00170 [Bacilli bacterium]|nr:hypothetical protein [Bacilli bacterium]